MDESISINNSERYAFAAEQLKRMLLRHMPRSGVYPTSISEVGMARFDESGISEHRFDRPLASFLVQGSKEIIIGEQKYKLGQGQILTVCVDMASSSKIIDASVEKPFLTFFFYINPAIIKELLIETNFPQYSVQKQGGVS